MNSCGMKLSADNAVEIVAVRVGPNEARILQEKLASDQRKLSQLVVNMYAKEMATGKWRVSNDALVMFEGSLLNGQHRLAAVVQSGTTQTFLLMEAADPSIIRVIDGGKPRRIVDVVRFETGMPYSKDVVAISDKVLAYDRGLLHSSGVNSCSNTTSEKRLMTRNERIAHAEKVSKAATEIITTVRPMIEKYGPIMSVMLGGSAWYLIQRADGADKAIRFIEPVYTGEGLSGAQRLLRTQLTRDATARRKLPTVAKFGVILKAYLSHRNGTVPGTLALKINEAFPKL